jgi:endonuclease/exonuclease/phosphatase (EEP) superfamily protein YafD
MELPDGREALLVNVRLMLPALCVNPLSSEARRRLVDSHRERINQFAALRDLIAEKKMPLVILAGDFNTPACARSLQPLRATLRDVWRVFGRGWGRTVTADFPVSRIDQCWVSGTIECIHGEVFHESLSDHRLLMVDLVFRQR